jgi:hypothetical protein
MIARVRKRCGRLGRSVAIAGLLALHASETAPLPLRAAAGGLLARLWPEVPRPPAVKPGRLVLYS